MTQWEESLTVFSADQVSDQQVGINERRVKLPSKNEGIDEQRMIGNETLQHFEQAHPT